MFVSRLKVYNFRNLADQNIDLANGLVYITGLNGNGKTNLVEALYLLSGSRSFRTSSFSELLKSGSHEGSIFGEVTTANGTEELGMVFTPEGRKAVVNGKDLGSVADLLGRFRVVAFSPTDLSLVKGSPSGRRRFLDRHMVDLNPPFVNVLMGYQRALASKSAVLKQPGCSMETLKPWNEVLASACEKIVDNRAKFLEILNEKSRAFHKSYAPSDGDLEIELESDFLREGSALPHDEILARFEGAGPREIATRAPTVGAQRDDLAIKLGGVDAKAYASQGQTRSVVLSMKLGVIEMIEGKTGEAPVIVLDDVDSELDRSRAGALFKALTSRPRQIVVTATQPPSEELLREHLAHLAPPQIVTVSDGVARA